MYLRPLIIFVSVLLCVRVHRILKEVAVFRYSSKKVNKEAGMVLNPCFFLYMALARLFLLCGGENMLGRVGAINQSINQCLFLSSTTFDFPRKEGF